MNNPLPTSVNLDSIQAYAADGYTVLTLDGRTIGCQVTDVSLANAEAIVAGWYMAYSNRQWIVGDFINQCAVKFGEAAHQIIPMDSPLLPNASSTLSNWCSVVAQYRLDQRLYPLSFSHYAAVAYVDDHREREALLEWAVENQASVQKLTAEKNSRVATQDAQGDDLSTPPVQTAIEIDNEQISQILTGNIRGLFSIIKNWRGVIQPGKKYRIILEEVK